MLIFLGAENGNALLKVVFGASIGKHGLGLRVDSDFLIGVDGVNAHGRPKAYAIIMSGYGLANAVVDLMDGDVLKGDEYTKVILSPVPCDAHIGILDVLEDRAHIGEYAVALGLAVPFIKQAHVAHVDRGDAPGAVAPCLEKCVGAPHKLAGSIEAREHIDAFGDCAFAFDLGYREAVVGDKPASCAKATIEFAQNSRCLGVQAFVKGWDDKTDGSNGVACDLHRSENGLFKVAGQLLECLVV